MTRHARPAAGASRRRRGRLRPDASDRSEPGGAVGPGAFARDLRAVQQSPPQARALVHYDDRASPESPESLAAFGGYPPGGSASSESDPELARLRQMYALLGKMSSALRFLFPVTGGLACWVAAGASFGGAFSRIMPVMVDAVNVLAFALASVCGAALFTAGYLAVALALRALRLALFGRLDGGPDARGGPDAFDDYGDYEYAQQQRRQTLPAEPYAYPEVATRRRATTPSTRRDDAAPGRGGGWEPEGGGLNGSGNAPPPAPSAPRPGPAPRPASAPRPATRDRGARRSAAVEAAVARSPRLAPERPSPSPNPRNRGAAARTPPKRKRVDLPIEVLMGLGGESLNAVGTGVAEEPDVRARGASGERPRGAREGRRRPAGGDAAASRR